ncbi:MAG: hypothetical protein WC838_01330 [Candidatus Margulisiibacteriota bacterium]|jgi:hypothetical protein
MAAKRLSPILRNILDKLKVDEKTDLNELKTELSAKLKRLNQTMLTVEKGLQLLKKKGKIKEEDFAEHLKFNDPLRKYLAKKIKMIMQI